MFRSIIMIIAALLPGIAIAGEGPTTEQINEALERLNVLWGVYQQLEPYVTPFLGIGFLGGLGAAWKARQKALELEKALDERLDALVKGIGGDLAAVADRERTTILLQKRRIVLVGETAPLEVWGQLSKRFLNLQARSYDELKGQDLTGTILAVVPQPAPEERVRVPDPKDSDKKIDKGPDFAPAGARLEAFMASVQGMNFPHAALVIGGYLPPKMFREYNDQGVLVSQSPGRMGVDLDYLIRSV